MVNNYNFELQKRAVSKFNIKDGQFLSNNIPNQMIPVVPVEEEMVTYRTSVTTSSGGSSLGLTDANKDFIITGYSLSMIKDATCDVADDDLAITYVFNGSTKYLAQCMMMTLTAQTINITQTGLRLRCDRNSSITLLPKTHTAGKKLASAVVYGYYQG